MGQRSDLRRERSCSVRASCRIDPGARSSAGIRPRRIMPDNCCLARQIRTSSSANVALTRASITSRLSTSTSAERTILAERQRIKRETVINRRLKHRLQACFNSLNSNPDEAWAFLRQRSTDPKLSEDGRSCRQTDHQTVSCSCWPLKEYSTPYF